VRPYLEKKKKITKWSGEVAQRGKKKKKKKKGKAAVEGSQVATCSLTRKTWTAAAC
jgi:hypothetical protein